MMQCRTVSGERTTRKKPGWSDMLWVLNYLTRTEVFIYLLVIFYLSSKYLHYWSIYIRTFFQTVRKLDFHQGGFLSRCEFRSLWKNEHSPYRTNLTQVHNKSIYKTVREVLPGQAVEENDSFLQDFLFYVNRDGMMTFDTERQEYPPMVQVYT